MKISTLIKTSVSFAILMVFGLAVADWLLAANLEEVSVTRERARTTERDISNLLVLTYEYAQYSEQRSLVQWKLLHNKIVKNLVANLNDQVPAPADALQKAKSLSVLFEQLGSANSTDPNLLSRQ